MPTVKLTDTVLRTLKLKPGERTEYFDATMPGFGLRTSHPTPKNPRGRKSWVVMHRFHGVQRRDTLGRYPGLSLKEARGRAGETFESVDRGVDPRAKPPEPPPETFGAVAEAFVSVGMVSQTGRAHAPRYLEEVHRNLDNHVLPRWAAREAASITLRDVVALLEAVRVGEPAKPASAAVTSNKTTRKIGGPIASNRVLSLLRPLFAWALASGRIDKNPCLTVKKVGEEHKRRRMLGSDELRDVWFGCAGFGYPFGTFLQTVLVTAQRRTAVARMRWSGLGSGALVVQIGTAEIMQRRRAWLGASRAWRGHTFDA